MNPNSNPNVSLTVILNATRDGLIALTPDGQELTLTMGPNTAATLFDWLLINERRQPTDERNTAQWHKADPTGRARLDPNVSDGINEVQVTKLPPRSRKIHTAFNLEDIGL